MWEIESHALGQKIYATPCEWNRSGIFILTEQSSQKDLQYLSEVVGIKGIRIKKVEKKVKKKNEPKYSNESETNSETNTSHD